MRSVIDITLCATGFRSNRTRNGIDADPSEPTEIYHQTVIATSQARTVVSAAANRNEQMVISAKVHGSNDVRYIGAARDEPRTLVDHGVVQHARLFVSRIRCRDEIATKALS
jgi:hypothetical protein